MIRAASRSRTALAHLPVDRVHADRAAPRRAPRSAVGSGVGSSSKVRGSPRDQDLCAISFTGAPRAALQHSPPLPAPREVPISAPGGSPTAQPSLDPPTRLPLLPEAWGTALLYLLALVPALLLLRAVDLNAVDVPFMDDWQFVPLIEQVQAGEIPWGELAAPHDEHRLLIPRILIIASTILSDGNYRVQCFITFGVVAARSRCRCSSCCAGRSGPGRATPVVWLLANLVVFSPIQWHNWLWPMQFCYFLPFTLPRRSCLAAFYSDLSAGVRFALCQALRLGRDLQLRPRPLVWLVMLPALLRDARWSSPRARRLAAASGRLGASSPPSSTSTVSSEHGRPRLRVPPQGRAADRVDAGAAGDQPGRDARLACCGFAFAMFGNAVARGFPVSSNLSLSIKLGCPAARGGVGLRVALARRGRLAGAGYAPASRCCSAFVTAALVGVVGCGPGRASR